MEGICTLCPCIEATAAHALPPLKACEFEDTVGMMGDCWLATSGGDLGGEVGGNVGGTIGGAVSGAAVGAANGGADADNPTCASEGMSNGFRIS